MMVSASSFFFWGGGGQKKEEEMYAPKNPLSFWSSPWLFARNVFYDLPLFGTN